MAVDADRIKEVFPEFEEISDEVIAFQIETAQDFVSSSVFGDKYDRALIYYVGHLLELWGRRGKAGSVTAERVGEVSRSYGAGKSQSENSDDLDSTTYGQVFKSLRSSLGLTPRVV